MKILKKIGLSIGAALGVALLGVGGMIGYLSLNEYRPEAVEVARLTQTPNSQPLKLDEPFTITSYNIGYGGLGEDQDFFMDGGRMVRPPHESDVKENLEGIARELERLPSDIYILQEVDEDSKRSYHYNQLQYFSKKLDLGYSFAYNFKTAYIPYPWPPIGKVASGLMTLSNYQVKEAQRIALPVPFTWPNSLANLKRCILLNRLPIEGSNKELVILNFHLEAYDSGKGKREQTRVLNEVLEAELSKGNYVIAGGDWNQVLPGTAPIAVRPDVAWQPAIMEENLFSAKWQFGIDSKNPTNRLNDAPLSSNLENAQYYAIDGFIVSPNVEILHTTSIDTKFKHSDHKPVHMQIKLKK